MTTNEIANQTEVRRTFWDQHPEFTRINGKRQNDYPVDVRMAFVDYVDHLCRDGIISSGLADKVTL